jgi:hypothetical protein
LKSLQELDKPSFEAFTSAASDPYVLKIRAHLLDPMLQHV